MAEQTKRARKELDLTRSMMAFAIGAPPRYRASFASAKTPRQSSSRRNQLLTKIDSISVLT